MTDIGKKYIEIKEKYLHRFNLNKKKKKKIINHKLNVLQNFEWLQDTSLRPII